MNIKSIEKQLKIIWDYMVLDEDFILYLLPCVK